MNENKLIPLTDNEIKTGLTELAEFCRKCGNLAKENDILNNALDLITRLQSNNVRLQGEIKAKTRTVFEKTVNKFLSIKDLYVIIDGEVLEWEPMEEVESLFGITLCEFDNDYEERINKLLKEMVGEENAE